MNALKGTISNIQPLSQAARALANERLNSLAMPTRALGRLMELAETLAAMSGTVNIDKALCPML